MVALNADVGGAIYETERKHSGCRARSTTDHTARICCCQTDSVPRPERPLRKRSPNLAPPIQGSSPSQDRGSRRFLQVPGRGVIGLTARRAGHQVFMPSSVAISTQSSKTAARRSAPLRPPRTPAHQIESCRASPSGYLVAPGRSARAEAVCCARGGRLWIRHRWTTPPPISAAYPVAPVVDHCEVLGCDVQNRPGQSQLV